MSDLYERLLAEARVHGSPALLIRAALVAVLELHKPSSCCGGALLHQKCDKCDGKNWPCPTVRAIARALDVPIGDQQ